MGVFNTNAVLKCDPKLIPAIANRICTEFKKDGYEGYRDYLDNGGIEISIFKDDFFKSVLGLDTALKIKLEPKDNTIFFDAGIGILGEKTIPEYISLFFAWPVLITQIWGFVQQSKLDDKALQIAKSEVRENNNITITILRKD